MDERGPLGEEKKNLKIDVLVSSNLHLHLLLTYGNCPQCQLSYPFLLEFVPKLGENGLKI